MNALHLNQPLVVTSSAKAKVWDATLERFGAARIFTSTVKMNLRLPGQQA